MNRSRRDPLLRAAAVVRDRLSSRHDRNEGPNLPTLSWQECTRLVRLIDVARSRGWHAAAERLQRHLLHVAAECRARLDELHRHLGDRRDRRPVSSLIAAYEDLRALEAEFGEVRFDRASRTLSVVTDPIVLEDVRLGPFEIRLRIDDLERSSPYDVVALEPNPSTNRASVTHPHVDDEGLCEGEGHSPIRNALAEGRLYDFFTVVDRVLRTYNAASAYVSLRDWEGVECRDCGTLVPEDERDVCNGCRTDLCEDCSLCCANCGYAYCTECTTGCGHCDQRFCDDCLTTCGACRANYCRECLDDEQTCPDCREEPEEVSANDIPADAAVHPDRVGQTALPA